MDEPTITADEIRWKPRLALDSTHEIDLDGSHQTEAAMFAADIALLEHINAELNATLDVYRLMLGETLDLLSAITAKSQRQTETIKRLLELQ